MEMKIFGIIAATLIAGLSLAGCGEKHEGPSRQAASQESTPVEKTQAEIKHVLEKDELLLNAVDSAKYPLYQDVVHGFFPETAQETGYCTHGFDSEDCGRVFKSWRDDVTWVNEPGTLPGRVLQDVAYRQKLLASIAGKAPHTQEKLLQEEFKAQYEKAAQELKNTPNICFLTYNWKFNFADGKYYFGNGDGNSYNFSFDLRNARGQGSSYNNLVFAATQWTAIYSGENRLPPIKAEKISDADYKRISQYAGLDINDESRPFLKICGSLGGYFDAYRGNSDGPRPIEWQFKMHLTKPIKIVDARTFATLEVVSNEWFGD